MSAYMRRWYVCGIEKETIVPSLSEGMRGGGEARLPKNNRNNVFLNPQLILQLYMGGPTFFREGGGPTFPGGGGGPDAYFHKKRI